MTYRRLFWIIWLILEAISVSAQIPPFALPAAESAVAAGLSDEKLQDPYILGRRDELLIKVLNEEELGMCPYPIDLRGFINVPMVGRMHAAGMTLEQHLKI